METSGGVLGGDGTGKPAGSPVAGSPAASPTTPTTPKFTACDRCRRLKSRCSGGHPCDRCANAASVLGSDPLEVCQWIGVPLPRKPKPAPRPSPEASPESYGESGRGRRVKKKTSSYRDMLNVSLEAPVDDEAKPKKKKPTTPRPAAQSRRKSTGGSKGGTPLARRQKRRKKNHSDSDSMFGGSDYVHSDYEEYTGPQVDKVLAQREVVVEVDVTDDEAMENDDAASDVTDPQWRKDCQTHRSKLRKRRQRLRIRLRKETGMEEADARTKTLLVPFTPASNSTSSSSSSADESSDSEGGDVQAQYGYGGGGGAGGGKVKFLISAAHTTVQPKSDDESEGGGGEHAAEVPAVDEDGEYAAGNEEVVMGAIDGVVPSLGDDELKEDIVGSDPVEPEALLGMDGIDANVPVEMDIEAAVVPTAEDIVGDGDIVLDDIGHGEEVADEVLIPQGDGADDGDLNLEAEGDEVNDVGLNNGDVADAVDVGLVDGCLPEDVVDIAYGDSNADDLDVQQMVDADGAVDIGFGDGVVAAVEGDIALEGDLALEDGIAVDDGIAVEDGIAPEVDFAVEGDDCDSNGDPICNAGAMAALDAIMDHDPDDANGVLTKNGDGDDDGEDDGDDNYEDEDGYDYDYGNGVEGVGGVKGGVKGSLPTPKRRQSAGTPKTPVRRDLSELSEYELAVLHDQVTPDPMFEEEPYPAKYFKKVTKKIYKKVSKTVIQYLVKWKGISYLHVEWVQRETIEREGSQGLAKIKRFQKEKSKLAPYGTAENPFDPKFLVVDRILAKKREGGKTQYLVKWTWANLLSATWENEDDLDGATSSEESLKRYEIINTMPPKREQKAPRPSQWEKRAESKEYKNKNKVFDYQLEGLNWLSYCWNHRRSCILADEMGLGKTVQSVTFLEHIHTDMGYNGPFLIIAPLSTIPHWTREFEGWTNMNVCVYHEEGGGDCREMMRAYDWYYLDENLRRVSDTVTKVNVIITTYEIVLADAHILRTMKWPNIIIDEAHRLKNKKSKLLEELRRFKVDHVVLLTGTPLQNNTEELWTLLNYIEPNQFSSLDNFMSQFGELSTSNQVEELHEVLRPYLLRRMKVDVDMSIPSKEETLVDVELTLLQKKYYRAIYDRNRGFLNKGCSGNNVPNLLNLFMELRKCCNHPFLIKGVEEKEAPQNCTALHHLNALVSCSGKLSLIDKLLPKLMSENHKVLIFSQMIKVLDLIAEYLKYKTIRFERIDGRNKGSDRQKSIDRFTKDAGIPVFLLCTRAGGLGINLTAADTVIIHDSDWNPQNDVQAMARCHRIGQTEEVKVYRLVAKNTYESEMVERASKKLGLEQAVFNNMTNDTPATADDINKPQMDKGAIDRLLKYGAYNIVEDDDAAARDFMEGDIDRILERNSRTVTFTGPEAKADVGAEGEKKMTSTLAKASFSTKDDGTNLDFDDPEFWEKALGPSRMERLKTCFAGAAKSSTARVELLADLEDFAKEIERMAQEGEMHEDRDKVMVLLSEIVLSNLFTQTERNHAKEMLSHLEKPTRKRKATLLPGAAMPGYNEIGTDDIPRRKKIKAWDTKSIRALALLCFENALYGKWEYIFETAFSRGKVERQEFEIAVLSERLCAAARNWCLNPEDKEVYSFFMKRGANLENSNIKLDKNERTHLENALSDLKITELFRSRAPNAWLKRLSLLRDVIELIGPDPQRFVLPPVKGPLPASWWRREDDRNLLIGYTKHGIGRFKKIVDDPNLGFSRRAKGGTPHASESDEDAHVDGGHGLPSEHALRLRIKCIFDSVEAHKKALAEAALKKPLKMTIKVKPKLESMTLSEKREVERVLFERGIPLKNRLDPDWAHFKSFSPGLAHLTGATVGAYVEALVDHCEAAQQDLDVTPPVDIPKLTKPRMNSLALRTYHFRILRTKFLHQDKDSQLRLLARCRQSRYMPFWWESKHDRILLIGTEKHGYGAFLDMMVDEELGWCLMARNGRMAKNTGSAFGAEEKDEKALFKRLRDLCDVIADDSEDESVEGTEEEFAGSEIESGVGSEVVPNSSGHDAKDTLPMIRVRVKMPVTETPDAAPGSVDATPKLKLKLKRTDVDDPLQNTSNKPTGIVTGYSDNTPPSGSPPATEIGDVGRPKLKLVLGKRKSERQN